MASYSLEATGTALSLELSGVTVGSTFTLYLREQDSASNVYVLQGTYEIDYDPHTMLVSGPSGECTLDYYTNYIINIVYNGSALGAKNFYLTYSGIQYGTYAPLGSAGSLYLSSRTANSVTLSWDSVINAAGYYIHYREYGTGSWTGWKEVSSSSTTTATIGNLTAGADYEFQYCAYDSNLAQNDWSDSGIVTTRPGASTSISISAYDSSSVTVKYGEVTGAEAYLVLCVDDATNATVETAITSDLQYKFEGLSPVTTYRFNYRGICYLYYDDLGYSSDYAGADSNERYIDGTIATAAVSCTTLTAIGKASITNFTRYANSITINFEAENASYYVVEYSTKGSDTWIPYNNGALISTTSCIVSNLSPGTSYEFYCYGTDGASNVGTDSDPVVITTKPAAAGTISFSSSATTSIMVSYGTVSGAEAYLVYCGSTGIVDAASPYTWSGLTAGTLYTFSYKGIVELYADELDGTKYDGKLSSGELYAAGTISSSLYVYTQPSIGTIVVSETASTSITVKMQTVTGATTYKVQYKTSDDSTYTTIDSPSLTYSDDGTYAYCKVDGLADKTTYYIRYCAVNGNIDGITYFGAAQSAWSSIVEVTTESARPEDWAWTNTPAKNSAINLTAEEWNGFCARINEFRVYKELTEYSFTTVYSKTTEISETICNQAWTAINAIEGHGTMPSKAVKNGPLYASFFTDLRDALNAIP